jgi:hypothetical protein
MIKRISICSGFLFPFFFSMTFAFLCVAEAQKEAFMGTASGTLSLNGKAIALKYAYAMAQPNAFDEKKTDVALLLSRDPLTEGVFKDVEQLENVAYGMHGYAFFKINDEGKSVYELLEHPALNDKKLISSGIVIAEFKRKVLDEKRIEGSFDTSGVSDFMGHRYEIHVQFSAPIQQAKRPDPLPDQRTGTLLPSDGGEPGKAYLAYVKAIGNKDMQTILKHFQAPAGGKTSERELEQSLDSLAEMAPKDHKIVKGYINTNGDLAALQLTAKEDGETVYGTVGLVNKGGIWKVINEIWSNTPPK